jgi:signal transduction histidine kinase
LKWVTTLVPTAAVFLYETVRHGLFDHLIPLPLAYGNLFTGMLTLILAYGFSEVIFGIVLRLQDDSLSRNREVAALTAAVQERERLSRELHDGVAQLISYMMIRVDTVESLVEGGREKEALAELEQLRGVADELYVDVRESIAGLRTDLKGRRLVPVLQDYLDAFEERHGLPVALETEGAQFRLPPEVAAQLFRIVQGALANVRKHAAAQHAWVLLKYSPRGLEMSVGDDGIGFDTDNSHAPGTTTSAATAGPVGLDAMRERAASLGGTCRVESAPGAGTRVTVNVPLPAVDTRSA